MPGRPLVASCSVDCHSDLRALWDAITDTESLNRSAGLAKVDFRPHSDDGAARYTGKTRLGGFDVEYDERPYEWVYLRSARVLRTFHGGPVVSIETAYLFDQAPDRKRVRATVQLTLVPRLAILAPIVRYSAWRTLQGFRRAIRDIDAALLAGKRPPVAATAAVDEGALHRATLELGKTDPPDLVTRLVDFVRTGGDRAVSRIRPYELADEWHIDRRTLLSTCLRAVRAGLLELRWEVVCPSCRTASQVLPSLAGLTDHGTCQLCEIQFALDLDQLVEATFSPNTSIRVVDGGPYCIGGPGLMPHVVAQAVLPAQGRAELQAPAESGPHRLFVRGGAAALVEVAEDGGKAEVDASALGAGFTIRVAPGSSVGVVNPEARERHVKLEKLLWASQAATAREVTSLPAFRRDFSADTLRPGAAIKVARVGIFFSDLTNSTNLYSAVGDAAAFRLVQDHFEMLTRLIEQHRGTLVKTIGDAVMSIFVDDLDGVAASVAILREFETFRARNPTYGSTHIRLGLFGGPCYAVTANRVLDYFGQTVNIAARLQAEAKSGELVVQAALADQAVAAGLLAAGVVRQRWEAHLKGVDQKIEAVRVRLGEAVEMTPAPRAGASAI